MMILLYFLALTVLNVAAVSKYIVQLNASTCIKEFIPRLVLTATELDHLDPTDDRRHNAFNGSYAPVRVVDTFDLDDTFKALAVELLGSVSMVSRLQERLPSDILSITPDEIFRCALTQPFGIKLTRGKRKARQRAQVNPDNLKHDENCPLGEHSVQPRRFSSCSSGSAVIDAQNISLLETPGNTYAEQSKAPWNLVRISQHVRNYSEPYIYDARGGKGVVVYVVDNGLYIDHSDFERRASRGWSAFDWTNATDDTSYHGTHVAGILGGKTYGVAKKVSLVSVQVLDDEGTGAPSDLLGALQWIIRDAKKHPYSIINMSFNIPTANLGTHPINEALTAITNAGIPIFAAAGNTACNACDLTPANHPKVFTVAAADYEDIMDPKSCSGSCIRMMAPGIRIKSDFVGSRHATQIMSGSSMATPHVTGIAALIMPSLANPCPDRLYKTLLDLATPNEAHPWPNTNNTPSLMAFNGQHMTSP